jgi:hypothetical protein
VEDLRLRQINIEKEVNDHKKRKKRSIILTSISSSVLAAFVLISYLGYTIGEYLANTTTIGFDFLNKEEVGIREVGFRVATPISINEQEKYSLVPDEYGIEGDGYVYWTSNVVNNQTLRQIIYHNGFSVTNAVMPITSRRFSKGDAINLYQEPIAGSSRPQAKQIIPADKETFISFTILFRVAKATNGETSSSGVANYGIFIGADNEFYGSEELLKVLRFGFESQLTSDIISPGRDTNDYTTVGGRLDLDEDGFFDATPEGSKINPNDESEVGSRYEIAYGDFLEPLDESNWGDITTESIPLETSITPSLHQAGTLQGVRPLLIDHPNYKPALQEHTIFSTYSAEFIDGQPIAKTDTKGVAEIKIQIWYEGWDAFSSNKLRSKSFGANLRFSAASEEDI